MSEATGTVEETQNKGDGQRKSRSGKEQATASHGVLRDAEKWHVSKVTHKLMSLPEGVPEARDDDMSVY